MHVMFTVRYSPTKGKRFEAGTIVDIDDETAIDLINRNIATPVRLEAEHAVAPGQGKL